MLINVPLESLEERYSAQWNVWFPKEFERLGVPYITVHGQTLVDTINTGVFLDVVSTNHFKASQLQQLCRMVHGGEIRHGDIIFFHDLWFPGLEMLAYIRDGLKLDIRIYGILHAGTYDPHDFLTRQGMRRWGRSLEQSWLNIVNGVFVATQFHRNLIMEDAENQAIGSKVMVTGLPLFPTEFVDDNARKENVVVFPHRLDVEKNPQLFDILARDCSNVNASWRFVKTKQVCTSKQQYYDLLNSAKVAISFADQETWGIAQLEALFCGCIPIVPNRLSYPELYPSSFRFNSFTAAVNQVSALISQENYFKRMMELTSVVRHRLQIETEHAIEKMVSLITLIEGKGVLEWHK